MSEPTPLPVSPAPSKGLLSGTAALIVGAIGMAAMAASAFVPAPWGTLVGVVGFLGAALAGLAAPPPRFAEGKPLLQGTAFTIATSVLALAQQAWPFIPPAFQPVALAVVGLVAWLTGRSMPALGTAAVPPPEPPKVDNVVDAARVFDKGPQP